MPKTPSGAPALLLLVLACACAGGPPALHEDTWKEKEKPMTSETPDTCCPILELRQYTLKPGQRDTLIALFEREFIESQEAVGMPLPGQFRDLDREDRFVWLRGFSDMASRHEGLTSFYGGPVWKANRDVANATMVDVSNVLLLRPARPGSGFGRHLAERPPVGATTLPGGVVLATVYAFESAVAEDFVRFFEQDLKPALEEAGLSVSGYFLTEASPNTFARLPVREGENVFVWFTSAPGLEAWQERWTRLTTSPVWKERLEPTLTRRLKSEPELLRLSPTPRSRLRD